MVVDPKYTSGVWYDLADGGFVRVENKPTGAALLTPDGDEFYEWDSNEEASRKLGKDFRPVPTAAVENPAEYLSEILDAVQRNATLTMEDRRGLSYVRSYHTIEVSE